MKEIQWSRTEMNRILNSTEPVLLSYGAQGKCLTFAKRHYNQRDFYLIHAPYTFNQNGANLRNKIYICGDWRAVQDRFMALTGLQEWHRAYSRPQVPTSALYRSLNQGVR